MPSIDIRPAHPEDAQIICDIYAFHVAHSTATFDTTAPDAAWWAEKIAECAGKGWPFLVAGRAGEVLAYAYAARFRDRAAYEVTCENSIYVADAARGQGIGIALLEALIDAARAAGFAQMIAVIGGGEPASVGLHARCGFAYAGRMRHVGVKFGRKLDTVYMQCDLAGEGWGND